MAVTLLRSLPILLALLVLTGCEQPQAQSPDATRPVKLTVLESANATALRQFPARVEASTRSNLSFRMAGELLALNVSPGQQVSEGEVIQAEKISLLRPACVCVVFDALVRKVTVRPAWFCEAIVVCIVESTTWK